MKAQGCSYPGRRQRFCTANSVAELVTYLWHMMHAEETSARSYETVYAANWRLQNDGSNSSPGPKRIKTREKEKEKEKEAKGKKKNRRGHSSSRLHDKDDAKLDYVDNPCPHCRKHKWHTPHPKVTEEKWFWNKRYT